MFASDRPAWIRGLPLLGLLWLGGAVVDRLWFAIDHTMPGWDQADYLAAALTYWRALQTPLQNSQWLSDEWWTNLWQLSSKMPPLLFISTTPFFSLFGAGPDQSTLVNLVFSAVLLGAVYILGTYLFGVQVGLWAGVLCLLMPELYAVRLDYLLDYPLAAIVTLTFACLTLWWGRPEELSPLAGGWKDGKSWLLAIGLGLSFGLALLTKQTALLFLFGPLVGVGLVSVWRRAWGRLVQLLLAMALALAVCLPWYRANWLLILTAGKRATIDSAIAENDPSLLSLDAWTYYLKALPGMVSLPLLIVPLVGLLLFWRRSRVSSQWQGKVDYAAKSKDYRHQTYQASRRSLLWLLGFWLSGYLLSSLNINKDNRYVVPYLPVLAVLLAYGLTLLPRWLGGLKWGTLGLAIALMLFAISPLAATTTLGPQFLSRHPAEVGSTLPHSLVAAEVARADPYLRSTIGVLPSTGPVNQHNVNYYGVLQNFQVHGRQVGVQTDQVLQDQRSLSWFLTKSGDQGSIRQSEAQRALTQAIEQNPEFKLQKSWPLPNGETLNLFRPRIPLRDVFPLVGVAERNQIQLDQVILPEQAPPGQPIPVTYRWSGSWKAMQSGLLLLTWQRSDNPAGRWLHDHSIALGYLRFNPPSNPAQPFQAIERMAMLPPASAAPGTYTLNATYLDRQTGQTYPIALPKVSLRIDPAAPSSEATELDWLTQLRTLALKLPQGIKEFDRISEEIARINQYAPGQDYADQARQAMEFRLRQEPQNLEFIYTRALASILKRRVEPAIAAFQQATQLDSNNPYPYAYLAFVNLYNLRPGAAQTAINAALVLKPALPELQALQGVAALMQGNVLEAWRSIQRYEALSSKG
ncbi:MAG TPA: glycosyltransferase family 39 protein [Thermosynechococcaceae cyanobacterium]